MKQIPLTKGHVALVDDEDFEALSRFHWQFLSGYRTGYAIRSKKPVPGRLLMHREIMKCPAGLEVDHVNGDGLDNRRENLRLATHTLNLRNYVHQKRNRKHDLPMGVSPVGKKFGARIMRNRRLFWLGNYDTPQQASEVYQAARRKSIAMAMAAMLSLSTL